jgi:hypothetical protein
MDSGMAVNTRTARAQMVAFEVFGEVVDDGRAVYYGSLGKGQVTEAEFAKTFSYVADRVCAKLDEKENGNPAGIRLVPVGEG